MDAAAVAAALLERPFTEAERELREERAAIREFDGGLPRAEAEHLATLDVLLRRRERDSHPRSHRR